MKTIQNFSDAEKLILIEAIVSGGIKQLTRSANYVFSVSDAKINPDAIPLGRANPVKWETLIQSNQDSEKPLKSLNTGLNYSFNDLELLQSKNKNQVFRGATADELTNRIILLINTFKIFTKTKQL